MLTGVTGEIKRRQLKKDYPAFVKYTNEGFCMTKFHHYVCSEVQEFLQTRLKTPLIFYCYRFHRDMVKVI